MQVFECCCECDHLPKKTWRIGRKVLLLKEQLEMN